MRRLIRRRKRLTALSLTLAMAAFIVTLPGWKRFEPTAQAAGITIDRSDAEMNAEVEILDFPGDPNPAHDIDSHPLSPFVSSYSDSVNAHASKNGVSGTANGNLQASLIVNGDELHYSSSCSTPCMESTLTPLGPSGRANASVDAHPTVEFTISTRSSYSLTGSLSIENDGDATVLFAGPDVSDIFTPVEDNTGRGVLPFSKTGVLAPGHYQLDYRLFAGGPGVSRASGNFTLTVLPVHDFHWINPAGGFFATSTNWNPAGVPGGTDTAIFDVSGAPPITVEAQNEIVARLLNRGMNLELHGSVQVLTGSAAQFGFLVDQGGQFLLDNGATLATQDADVGGPTGSPESTMSLLGAGTQWTIASRKLSIGNQAPGRVVVLDDSSLNAQISIQLGANGGAGTLRVEHGGLVQTPFFTIEQGSVQVTGQGVNDSKLQVASQLDVGGQNGPGSMLLENGGTVQAQRVFVGDSAGNGGDTITISGVDKGGLPSTLFVTGGPGPLLQVLGGAGTQVEVKDGGLLAVGTSGRARIGDKFNVGKVIVHGKAGATPATWECFGDIFIGGEIVPSELIVTDGGRVRATIGQLIVGSDVNALGRVEVSGSDSFLSADTLIVGADGHGELTIDEGGRVQSAAGSVGQSSQQFPPARGSGSVTITGRLLFPSEWHVTGNCFVGTDEPGEVVLKSTSILPFSAGAATLRVDATLVVGTQGLIKGNGTLAASHLVNHGAIIPGLSPGIIVIEGDYQQAADGVLKMEAAGLADGQFDVLHVTGNTSLGGTLEVRFLNGYLPRTGDVIPFLKLDGAVTGSFGQIIFPQLAPGFQFKTELVNGSYQLTALNDAALAPTSSNGGTIQFSSATYSVAENVASGNATITITRTGGSAGTATVVFSTSNGSATAGQDYTSVNQTVTFNDGEISKTVDIPILDDSVDELNETVNLTLTTPGGTGQLGAQATAVLTINDNDKTISISDVSVMEGNSGTTNAVFNVTLSGASALTVTVNYATADGTATMGTDYQPTSGTLTFDPGQTSKTITVLVNGDTMNESGETFFVNLSGATNATIADNQGVGTILNDDSPGFQFSLANYPVAEDGGSVTITVTRTGDPSATASVDYATSDGFGLAPSDTINGLASERCDYLTALGTLKFAPGVMSRTFVVFLTDDVRVEGAEVFNLTLSNAVGGALGAQNTATVTIADHVTVPGAANPIDTTDFFIRQLYMDFLYREPDTIGFQNWRNTLNGCPSGGFGTQNPQCDRVHVAKSFYDSQEFGERGYFIYRFYHAGLGGRPTYLQFMRGMQRIGGNLDQMSSEAAKMEFIMDFMQTPEFQALYGGLLTPAKASEFITKLEETSGVHLSEPLRSQLISDMGSGAKSAAQTLRGFMESPEVFNGFYDRGFVAMLYFGHLRRNPDDIGYNNWLQELNLNHSYRNLTFGFIYSTEYRLRFGQP